ncbi:MAG: phosphoenolpyruvate--protein phosphotransferase [Alphaproteobacteria bacterium]|nr:phosphoenolpyruvate--protein phosphotransferase [Alphaproteobacteria bacterium]NDC55919.1 phosphoenolpyruvate--protein phosphotransferase [Alphaproteobacteria bacterium]NDG04339.1 phosphoenolpyruvate--protein phosphotransferase [Alphaproteobacteria bacterium]
MRSDETRLIGHGVSPGIAIGHAFVIESGVIHVPDTTVAAGDVDDELARLHTAIDKARRQLMQLKGKASQLPAAASEDLSIILDAHMAMLSGSRLVRGSEDLIKKEKLNAAAAVQQSLQGLMTGFAAMEDAYLSARAADLQDVGHRVIRQLLHQKFNPFALLAPGSIVFAEEISPADTAQMNPELVSGFAATLGGAEGHAAIMARSLGIPAVMGIGALLQHVNTGDEVIVDGFAGEVIVCPQASTLKQARSHMAKRQADVEKLKGLRKLPAETQDGVTINLQANIELPRDMTAAMQSGAAGIGLLRTEFMFMNRPDLPDEDEQTAILAKMVKTLDGKPLTIRTLDVGGEKLATSLQQKTHAGPNPALGLRAIRYCLQHPEILETQLAACLRASALGPVRILIPMVSSVRQMLDVREHMVVVAKRLSRRGIKTSRDLPPLGAMIEIPAAALAADALAHVCDYFAIGSNDLTQYTLAIDRGDDQVASLYNPIHPAVLRLIQFTVAAALRARIPVSLCGEMAGDPDFAPLLIGLGLRELSMSPARLPEVKRTIRDMHAAAASGFAELLMTKNDESEIKSLIEQQTFFVGSQKKHPHT